MKAVFIGFATGFKESYWLSRLLRAVLCTLFALTLFEVVVLLPFFQRQFESDTGLVLTGVTAIRRCLADGIWERCPNVSRLPPLQYIPALAASLMGIDQVLVLTLLSIVSTIGLVITLMLVLRGAQAPGAPALAAAAWIGGYGIWYVHSTFAEALAAWLVTLAVALCHHRRPALALIMMTFAAMSKETAGPFLLALGALALALRPTGTSRSVHGTAVAATVGVVVGMICNAAFNIFRYGTPLNRGYLEAGYRVAEWGRRGEYFVAQWVSPNGGVLLFAPILCLAIVVALRSRTDDIVARWVTRAAVCVPIVMAVGFSLWYSPMGWWGYGSRYLMPWLPATLMLTLLAHGDAWGRWARAMGPRRYLALSVGLALLALPHVLSIVDASEYTRFSDANPECGPGVDVLTDPVGQARSMRCQLFPHWYFLPLWIMSHAPEHLEFVASYVTVLVLLLHRAAQFARSAD